MDIFTLAAAGFFIFLGTFFATVSGFGFALVSTPLLCLVFPAKEAIVFILVLTVLLRVLTMYRVWGEFDWTTVLLTVGGSFVGMWPGSYVLRTFDLTKLELFLGIVLIVATILMCYKYTVPIKNKTLGRLGAGFLSGFFGAATSVSGPPLVLYFLNEQTEKTLMRANMIWIFGLGGVLMVLVNYFAGNITSVNSWYAMWSMVPATFVGVLAGERLFFRLNQELFRRLSLGIVFVGAIMMLVNAMRHL